MTQTRGQDFDWSDCRLLDSRNTLFLRGQSDLIAGDFERKIFIFSDSTIGVMVLCALLYRTPVWFYASIGFLLWGLLIWCGLKDNRKMSKSTSTATLLKGEVVSATLPDTLDYGGSKVFIRFETPSQNVIETHTDSQRDPDQWQAGDKIVVLYRNDERFWVL